MKTNVTLNGRTYKGIDRFILDGKIFKFTGEIPEGYTAIKGIKNPNAAYIDIGMPVLSTDVLEFSFNFDDRNAAVGTLCGWRIVGGTTDGNHFLIAKNNVTLSQGGSTWGRFVVVGNRVIDNQMTAGYDMFDDNDHTVCVYFTQGKITVDGEELEIPMNLSKAFSDGSSVYNPILFGQNNSGTAAGLQSFGDTLLYGFSVIRNGEYVVEMLPVKKSDGTIGMYDIARGQFFGSSNAQVFTE